MCLGLDFNHHRLTTPVSCRILLRVAKTQVTPAGERNTAEGRSEDQNSAHPTSAHKATEIPDPICSPKGEVIPAPEMFTMGKSPQLHIWCFESSPICSTYAVHSIICLELGWEHPFPTPQMHQLNYYTLVFWGVLCLFSSLKHSTMGQNYFCLH